MVQTVDEFVNEHVLCCVSLLVSELSQHEKYFTDLLPVICREETESDPERVALEHWIVSDWLARQIEARGGMVVQDFFGLAVWGRETSGLAIAEDPLIREIYEEVMK